MSRIHYAARILACVSLIALYSPVIAEPVHMIGVGRLSCGKWAEARNEDNERQVSTNIQWIAGFVAGHNYYRDKRKSQAEVNDLPTITLWVDTYCKSNPTHSMMAAATALVEELGGVKALHPWRR